MHSDNQTAAPQLDKDALTRWLCAHGWTTDPQGRFCTTRPGLAFQRARALQYRVVIAPAGVRVEVKEPDCKGVRLPWFRVSYGVWGKTIKAAPGGVSIGGALVTAPPRA